MKVSPDLSHLYLELYEKAKSVTFISLKNLDVQRKEEIAHDITVDFLYSFSYNFTYDSKKGAVLPFFSSYVKKKLMGFMEKKRREAKFFVPILSESEGFFLNDFFEMSFEMRQFVDHVKYEVKGLTVFGVSLERVWDLILISVLYDGRLNCSWFSKELGQSYDRTKTVISQVQRIARRCYCA